MAHVCVHMSTHMHRDVMEVRGQLVEFGSLSSTMWVSGAILPALTLTDFTETVRVASAMIFGFRIIQIQVYNSAFA